MRKVERPSREQLKDLIRKMSFLEIGKLFGVSDKAITKWCKHESLPHKKREIKSISDEMWMNIWLKGTHSNLIQAEDFVNFVAIFVPCIFESYGEVRSTEGEAALKAVTDKTDVGS